jgi:hypothetical protein
MPDKGLNYPWHFMVVQRKILRLRHAALRRMTSGSGAGNEPVPELGRQRSLREIHPGAAAWLHRMPKTDYMLLRPCYRSVWRCSAHWLLTPRRTRCSRWMIVSPIPDL